MICIQCLCTVLLRECIQTFWNHEANPGLSSFFKRGLIYTQIQLIGSIQTEVQAGIMMTIFLVSISVTFSLNVVTVIRFPWTGENVIIIGFCGYMALLCMIGILFLVDVFAGVWTHSKIMFEKLARSNITTRNFIAKIQFRLQQKFWRSCRNLIKVRFGVNNFVEKDALLNCLQYTISLTVQILLLNY